MRGIAIVILSLFTFCLFADEVKEQVDVGLMEVWVKVTDKQDRPVTDLGPEDFRIFVDGQEMTVRCFDRAFTTPLTAEDLESEPMKRRFIFFFDLLNSSPGDVAYLKKSVMEFLQTSFADQDEGMVFALVPSMKLGVVQNMTSNKESLIDVINKVKGNPTLALNMSNNEKQLMDILYQIDTTYAVQGSPFSPGPRSSEPIREARALAKGFASQEELRAKHTLDSFLGIASYLSNSQFSGRVVMLYISGGFPLHPGQQYFDIIERAIDAQYITGPADFHFRDRATNDFLPRIKETTGILNRLNVTIYSIDSKGLLNRDQSASRSFGQIQNGMNTLTHAQNLQDSLVMLARETGGDAFLNSQNYDAHLANILRDMNEQYWLCANLPLSRSNGQYHKIEVKVNRPGMKVRHRKGYVD